MHGVPARVRASRTVAAGLGAILLVGGGIALGNEVSDAFAATTAGACTLNPMGPATPAGSDAGFTVWTSGDLHLRNQETEGSIAVGGTLRVSGSGQYPVVHKIAGDGNYSVPVIDGARTRVFLNRYAHLPNDTKIQLKREGATLPEQFGGLKIASPNPAYTIGSGENNGTAYYLGNNNNQGIVDLGTPFTDVATATAALVSDSSWSSYFTTSTTDATATLDDAAYGTPDVLGTSGEAGVRLVAGDNQIAFSAISGIDKMRLEGEATGVLYVKVAATDVVGGILKVPSLVNKPDARRVLWDLSDVSGAVRLTAQEPIRGAVYAPDVDLAITDKEIEGQVIARSLDNSAGNEIHTYLFASALPCAAAPTTTTPATTEPATTAPATTAPATTAPATTAPATTAPATTAPATTAPATTAPATTTPATTAPATTEPATTAPATSTDDGGVGDEEGDGDDSSTSTGDGGVGDQEGDGDGSTTDPSDGGVSDVDDELPTTGAEAVGAAVLALMLAGGGLGLLAVRRRQNA
ncbi:collagen-binding domain-containing protein [Sanguibacter sp. HDW7]|uniref:collagen-binding domain-containing protein n=1 Tax=Sanguibacter sp. HDW7 TaxID=2714931 RepID=UPI00140D0E7E|nr:collagen-binding domain-containing protein [Sanguibacter sp. HDW7]QIK82234.1 choice-of-anchor A family protein [Sanguibacter sp. HDW7]